MPLKRGHHFYQDISTPFQIKVPQIQTDFIIHNTHISLIRISDKNRVLLERSCAINTHISHYGYIYLTNFRWSAKTIYSSLRKPASKLSKSCDPRIDWLSYTFSASLTNCSIDGNTVPCLLEANGYSSQLKPRRRGNLWHPERRLFLLISDLLVIRFNCLGFRVERRFSSLHKHFSK